MDEQLRQPRVVVGVDVSLAGLAALRVAADEARWRHFPLYAVRATRTALPGTGAGSIESAFCQALGSVSADVGVHFCPVAGMARRALLDYACEPRDLLVIGASGRGRRRVLPGGSVEWAVRGRAACAVRTVRAPETAGIVRGLRRALHRGGDCSWQRLASMRPDLHHTPQRGD